MTEEVIEKKAEEYATEQLCDLCICKSECKEGAITCNGKEGFIAGTKLMQKENADLQHRLDIAQGFLDRDMEYNRLLDVINNQDVKIADLEKKVKYYEQQLSAMEKGVCDVCKVKDADYYEKQIADLEKRNSELAGQKASLQRWLGEAKGIIKDLLNCLYDFPKDEIEYYQQCLDKAEQFLKG